MSDKAQVKRRTMRMKSRSLVCAAEVTPPVWSSSSTFFRSRQSETTSDMAAVATHDFYLHPVQTAAHGFGEGALFWGIY